MGGANVSVLNGGRLSSLLVDGKHCDVAFTGAEHHLAVHVFHSGPGGARQARPIAQIDKAAAGMDVNRAGGLDPELVIRVSEGGLGV
jgi:hypothetical protein